MLTKNLASFQEGVESDDYSWENDSCTHSEGILIETLTSQIGFKEFP